MNECAHEPECVYAQSCCRKGSLWFADKKGCLFCEPLGGLQRCCPRAAGPAPAPCCDDGSCRAVFPAAAATGPAQPAMQTWHSGTPEGKNKSGIVVTSPCPRLFQLLIKDVGGPGPGTQSACPLMKWQTRSVALQEVADEFISWPFRRPNRTWGEDGSVGGHAGWSPPERTQ